MASNTRRRSTRTAAPDYEQESEGAMPAELEGIDPTAPHPYYQNPASPPDYCFCGQHKSSVLHGGPAAATAPPHARKVAAKKQLRSSAQIASEKAGVRKPFITEKTLQEEQDEELELAAAEEAVETIRANRAARLAGMGTGAVAIGSIGGITGYMPPFTAAENAVREGDRVPIVDQAIELAQQLSECDLRNTILEFAAIEFLKAVNPAYLMQPQ